jgi:hypothetical protein
VENAVIHIQVHEDGTLQFFLDKPYDTEGRRPYNLGVDLASPAFEDFRSDLEEKNVVHSVGNELFTQLKRHPALNRAVFKSLVNVDQTESAVIYFEVDHAEVDRLPWESLHHDEVGFIALDERFPIARLQQPSVRVNNVFDFATPVRFMVLLSAASKDPQLRASALGEWNELYATLKVARDNLKVAWQLPDDRESIVASVYVAEDELRERISSLNESWITVSTISDEAALLAAKKKFNPHLMHVFCHGSDDHLTLGTRADWNGDLNGSIDLTADLLARDVPNLWLVSLNACGSAAASGNSLGFARRLVIKGIPAAVGMRERIDTRFAGLLCRHFYRALLERISTIDLNADPQRVDWAACLWSLREKSARDYHRVEGDDAAEGVPIPDPDIAMRCRHWTLPVLYTHGESFQLRRRAERSKTRAQLIAKSKEIQHDLDGLSLMRSLPEAELTLQELRRTLSAKIAEIEAEIASMDAEQP